MPNISLSQLSPAEIASLDTLLKAFVSCCPEPKGDCDGCPKGTDGYVKCVNAAKGCSQNARDYLRGLASVMAAEVPHRAAFVRSVLDDAEASGSSKTWLYVLLGVAAVGVVGGGAYWYTQRRRASGPATALANGRRRRRRRSRPL